MKCIYYPLMVLLLFSKTIIASEESFHNSIKGTQIMAGASFIVKDDKLNTSLWNTIDQNLSVVNLVIWQINEDSNYYFYGVPFTCSVDMKISYSNANGLQSTKLQTLTVNFDTAKGKPFNQKAAYKFINGYKVKVEILSIHYQASNGSVIPPPCFLLSAEIYISRKYKFDCNQFPDPVSKQYNPQVDKLRVSWGSQQGAEEYDLEYTYYSDYSELIKLNQTVDFNSLFTNNSTRITTPSTYYFINLIYPEGYIFYRIRGVQYATDGHRMTGAWSCSGIALATSFTLCSYHVQAWHQQNMNWEYSAAFAEEGRSKVGLSYFDGSLRNRQTLAYNQSLKRTIVAETIYDYQGRPAVQVMPVPSLVNKLMYLPKFNRHNDTAYYRKYFDVGDCGFIPLPMDSTKGDFGGSSNYYSQLNPDSLQFNAFIPNAHKYPFSITEWTPDNTGRIKRQSGVGIYHKLGSNHESKYYYGKPAQEMLDRMFGNEVGWSSHYLKNMVRDPNGQISVSYLDTHGRTIATALAGEAPVNLVKIPEYNSSQMIPINLLDNNLMNMNGFINTYLLLATNEGDYAFAYTLDTLSYHDACLPSSICYDCLYDLVIIITDDCGNAFNNGVPYIRRDSNYTISNLLGFDTLCSTHPDTILNSFTLHLPVGSYNISKSLTISESALNFYTEKYVNQSICEFPFDTIYQHLLDDVDFSGCNMTCEECFDALGSESDFIAKYIADLLEDTIVLSASDTIQAKALYNATYNKCGEMCHGTDVCSQLYELLLADVSPNGQYATFSIDNTTQQLTLTGAYNIIKKFYDQPSTPYLNNAGEQDSVDINGMFYAPQNLTPDDFFNHFKPSWAVSLVQYHPEYCYYSWCTKNDTSNRYDNLMDEVQTYHDADSLGLLDPLGIVGSIGSYPDRIDPFFIAGGLGSSYSQQMNDTMLKYLDSQYDIWDVSAAFVKSVNSSDLDFSTDFGSSSLCVGDLNQQWCTFRSLYLNLKQLFIDKTREDYMNADANDGCYSNCCIGIDDTDIYTCSVCNNVNPGCTDAFYNDLRSGYVPRVIHFGTFLPDLDVNSFTFSQDAQALYSTQLTSWCTSVCEANADAWMTKLSGCVLSPAIADSIRKYLILICEKGCDGNHPHGSSTVPTGSVIIVPSDGHYLYSFDNVLQEFIPGYNITDPTCSSVLLSAPSPYYSPQSQQPEQFFSEDTCICSRISEVYNAYIAGGGSASDFAVFLNNIYASDFSQEQVNELLTVCGVNGGADCKFLTGPLKIPPGLSCESKCISCCQLNNAIAGFKAGYGFLSIDIYDEEYAVSCRCREIADADFADSLLTEMNNNADPAENNLFTSFLNTSFGLNFTFEDYYNFHINNCHTFVVDTGCGGIPSYIISPDSLLCPPLTLLTFPADTNPCLTALLSSVKATAQLFYQNYIDSIRQSFQTNYITKCMEALETFKATIPWNEYHFTLYYYDQGGNLIKTIPPNGVKLIATSAGLDSVKNHRQDPSLYPMPKYPNHTFLTRYWYNTLNQTVKQNTPDADSSRFWYDRIGRLVVSQNKKQFIDKQYSYTVYDALGRIAEVGEIDQGTPMSDAISIDTMQLKAWLAGGVYSQVTHTYYDIAVMTIPGFLQKNLRNRIATVTYEDVDDNISTTYNAATHYDYDAEGNVKTIVQENPSLKKYKEQYKRIDYEYDLVSGNVNRVYYQRDSTDQFIHHYMYDQDNRLMFVETSKDGYQWERDADYFYYPHGPLAREQIGSRQVQGIDYAYTIQGWLKAVNGMNLDRNYDMGRDGKSAAHIKVAADAYGFVLNYFEKDYKPIATSFNNPEPQYTNSTFDNGSADLWNGNIRNAAYSINGLTPKTIGYAYDYDQLNRLVAMDADKNFDSAKYIWTGGNLMTAYKERVNYDPNGNIQTYLRHGNNPIAMDSFTYSYQNGNKLDHVDDNTSYTSNYTIDIDDQSAGNYTYDAIGNMIGDVQEGLTIDWNVYGKIKKVTDANDFRVINFGYDATGNRIKKQVVNTTNHDTTTTYYVRDVQGNILSTYTARRDTVKWNEQMLYGGSRVGVANLNSTTYPIPPLMQDTATIVYPEGYKTYELTNHLGNVLVTISDKKIGIKKPNQPTKVDYWVSEVLSRQDYYPGGMIEPGRNFSSTSYNFGYQGSLKDDEIKGSGNSYTTEFRELDPRINQWWSIDPEGRKTPWMSPYVSMGDNQVLYTDRLGNLFGIEGFGSNKTQRQEARKIARENNGTINAPLRSHINVTYSAYDDDLAANPSKGMFTTSINPDGSTSTTGAFPAQPCVGPDNTPEIVKQVYRQQAAQQEFTNQMYSEADQMSPMGLMLQGKNIVETLPFVYGGEILKGAMISAEAKAGIELMKMEEATGGHFLAEHGAWTTLDQQLFRVTDGITPSGICSPSSSASRFFTNEFQLQAAQKAINIFQQSGRASFPIEMGTTIGEGYLGGQYTTSSTVQAVFRNGQLYTLYPLLK